MLQADLAQHGLPELPVCTCIITNNPPTSGDVSKPYNFGSFRILIIHTREKGNPIAAR